MGDVLTTARQEAVNGLRGGGQIAPALLAQRAENALKRLYLDSNMLSIPVYIDQEEDERIYTIPDPVVTGLEIDRHLLRLNQVAYDAPADEDNPLPSEVSARNEISKANYGITTSVASSAVVWSLELYWTPGDDVTAGLELVQAYSSALDDYIPAPARTDARTALTALLRHLFMIDTGRPWTDPESAPAELGKYMAYMGRIRISANTEFTDRTLTAQSSRPFII